MPPSETPLLIVNADDLGWNREATDLTLECFGDGLISSTTVLLHMADSRRAAELALESGIPTGLHLNLTDPLDGLEVPGPVRDRHAAACRLFADGHLRMRSWTYDPRIETVVVDAIRDQLEGFRAAFGRAPTHVDGHNHVQVCPNVVRATPLRGYKLRNALWAWPSTRTAMGLLRAARRRLTAFNHLTPRYFFDIAELESGGSIGERVDRSRSSSVEMMCHPGFGHELRTLTSAAWKDAIADLPVGSYLDLN
jgi:predicted glycoside hydrolase/deacetylase ChbG (UPF0249 family)